VLKQVPSHYEIKQKLLQRGTSYLYSNPYPTTPIIFKTCGYDKLICIDGVNHVCKLKEYRYGKALMITKICVVCDFAEIEVFPPKENRVIQ
jgi:hypothetical protein